MLGAVLENYRLRIARAGNIAKAMLDIKHVMLVHRMRRSGITSNAHKIH